MKRAIIVIMSIILLTGCKQTKIKEIEMDIDSIYMNLVDKHESGKAIYLTFELINKSEVSLQDMEVLMGYETSQEYKNDGYPNDIMFYARPDEEPFDIEPNESRFYSVEVPVGLLKVELLETNQIELFIKGYFGSIDIKNSFSKGGNMEFFEENTN